MRTTSLPFELDHDEIRPHHVPAQSISGTVSLEGDAIVLHFSLEGTAAAPRTATIPLTCVERMAMTGGTVKSPRLVLEVSRDDLLTMLPWADGRMCVMRFRRAHGQKLRELIEEIEVRIAEIRAREEQQGHEKD
jgi:hypothetical protein